MSESPKLKTEREKELDRERFEQYQRAEKFKVLLIIAGTIIVTFVVPPLIVAALGALGIHPPA